MEDPGYAPPSTKHTLTPCVNVPLLLWQAAASAVGSRSHVPAREPQLLILVMSEYYLIVKTFNNGSLGSGIDEERSEMR